MKMPLNRKVSDAYVVSKLRGRKVASTHSVAIPRTQPTSATQQWQYNQSTPVKLYILPVQH
jgi:hypothetical protein